MMFILPWLLEGPWTCMFARTHTRMFLLCSAPMWVNCCSKNSHMHVHWPHNPVLSKSLKVMLYSCQQIWVVPWVVPCPFPSSSKMWNQSQPATAKLFHTISAHPNPCVQPGSTGCFPFPKSKVLISHSFWDGFACRLSDLWGRWLMIQQNRETSLPFKPANSTALDWSNLDLAVTWKVQMLLQPCHTNCQGTLGGHAGAIRWVWASLAKTR